MNDIVSVLVDKQQKYLKYTFTEYLCVFDKTFLFKLQDWNDLNKTIHSTSRWDIFVK